MKKHLFFALSLYVMAASTLSAQDAIHGVDGYYNFTPKQMQSDNLIYIKTTGYTLGSPITNHAYLDFTDNYVRVNMGLNAGNNNFRTDWDFSSKYDGASPLRITKKYPVIAVKMGYCPTPQNMLPGATRSWQLRWKFHGGADSTVYTVATTTADGVVHPINAFQESNGGVTFYASSYRINTPNGKAGWDSNHRIQIDNWLQSTLDGTYYHNWNVRNAIGDSVDTAQSSSSTNMGYFMVADPDADVIVYVNLASVFERDAAKYDGDIDVYRFGMIMNNFFCDTTMIVNKLNENGDSIGLDTITKPRELLPYYNIKWIKTFASPTALKEATMINAGDGNDARSDNQLSLNAVLYFANKALRNYGNADVDLLQSLQMAYNEALVFYNSTPTNNDNNSDEWKTWDTTIANAIGSLNDALSTFKYEITNNISESYNVIKSAGATSELMVGASATIKGVSGKLVAFGGVNSGTPLTFAKSTTLVNGLTAYSLITSSGRVCLVNDTLLFVEAQNVTSSSPTAYFVFSNRNDKIEPFYDIYVNGKYLIIDENTGKMATADEIPDGDISELANYLFNIAPATYDASNDDPNLVLYSGYEFNGPTLEGWEPNPWRKYSALSLKEYGEMSYAVLGSTPTYYHATDTLFSTLLDTPYGESNGSRFRREGATYTDYTLRTVSQADSSKIIWTNTYKARYLAIKTVANDTIANFSYTLRTLLSGDAAADFTAANRTGKKGDVSYWDMLALGVPYGDKGWVSQDITCAGFMSSAAEIYIDWIRTYASIDEIPSELIELNTAVKSVNESSVVQILVMNKTISVKTEKTSSITLMNLNGQILGSAKGTETKFTVNNAGIYLVTALENNQMVTRKVIIK